jgi:hypothetical protein
MQVWSRCSVADKLCLWVRYYCLLFRDIMQSVFAWNVMKRFQKSIYSVSRLSADRNLNRPCIETLTQNAGTEVSSFRHEIHQNSCFKCDKVHERDKGKFSRALFLSLTHKGVWGSTALLFLFLTSSLGAVLWSSSHRCCLQLGRKLTVSTGHVAEWGHIFVRNDLSKRNKCVCPLPKK